MWYFVEIHLVRESQLLPWTRILTGPSSPNCSSLSICVMFLRSSCPTVYAFLCLRVQVRSVKISDRLTLLGLRVHSLPKAKQNGLFLNDSSVYFLRSINPRTTRMKFLYYRPRTYVRREVMFSQVCVCLTFGGGGGYPIPGLGWGGPHPRSR